MEFLNGNKMFVDALSRMPSPPIATNAISTNPLSQFAQKSTPLLDLDILLAQQKRDPTIHKVLLAHKNLLPDKRIPKMAQYTHIHQGLVCCTQLSYGNKKRVILVPLALRPLLLYLVHDECGHTSVFVFVGP